jgi:hypothetical protein
MKPPFLDRRVYFSPSPGGVSSWTLPYNLPVNIPLYVVNAVTGARINSTRPALDRVAVGIPQTGAVYVGLPFVSSVKLSPPVVVRRDFNITDRRGPATVREYVFHIDADSKLLVTIARFKRPLESRNFDGKPEPQISEARCSVLHNAPTSVLTAISRQHFPLRLTGGECSFTFSPQTRAY